MNFLLQKTIGNVHHRATLNSKFGSILHISFSFCNRNYCSSVVLKGTKKDSSLPLVTRPKWLSLYVWVHWGTWYRRGLFSVEILIMLSDGQVSGTFYGMQTPAGWTRSFFSSWFTLHFLKHATLSWPLLLILDNHSSHFTLNVVKFAAEHEIIIFCLPLHTTVDSQLPNMICFGQLKTFCSQACLDYYVS